MDNFLELMDLSPDNKPNTKSKIKKSKSLSGIKGGKNNFRKADIAKYISEVTGCNLATALKSIDAMTDFINLYASDKDSCVTIAGFGSFKSRSYKFNTTLRGKNYKGTTTRLVFTPSKNPKY